MRQVVLDTETTGLDFRLGDRVIEIGCVELLNRKLTGQRFHRYINPEREVEAGALAVHGLSNEFLQDKPRFGDIAAEFLDFIQGAELVIHNAAFDVGFLNAELARLGPEWGVIEDYCRVIDTLALARKMHPGQRNSLDALCQRYEVNNAHRELHGALLDARILADVYLAMTGGQASLTLNTEPDHGSGRENVTGRFAVARPPLVVLRASADELAAHERYLAAIDQESGGNCLWRANGV